jgi:hypothetical protein
MGGSVMIALLLLLLLLEVASCKELFKKIQM